MKKFFQRKTVSLITIVAAAALLVAACTDAPVAVETDLEPQFARQGPFLHSVTGHGQFTYFEGGEGVPWFASFTARVGADGSVSGQASAMLHGFTDSRGVDHAAVVAGELDVVCLSVSGNRAWIGTVIKNSTNMDWIGFQTGWVVEDNGSSGDRLRIARFPHDPAHFPNFAQDICTNQSLVPNSLLTGGNIRVR